MGYKIGDYLTVMFRYGKPTMVQDDQMSTETLIVIGLKPGSEHFVEEAICYVPPDSICQTPHRVGTKELKEYGINSKYLGDSFISVMPGYVKKVRDSISAAFCGKCCEPMPYAETKNGTMIGPILCWQCRNDPYRLSTFSLAPSLASHQYPLQKYRDDPICHNTCELGRPSSFVLQIDMRSTIRRTPMLILFLQSFV